MQLELFTPSTPVVFFNSIIELAELFEAYFSCRSNKRKTANATAFEVDYEKNLIQLSEEINNGTYQPGTSIAFIVNKPVTREIFAAGFKDRVVHHWLINKLNPLFEKEFIYDSYACREGKGTHFGIQRVDKFIRQCSANYTKNCYLLKMDIKGFFMHINKNILFEKLSSFINLKYMQADKELVLSLCKKVIFNDAAKNCIIKGKQSNWSGLPSDKSLFHSPWHCGLPIGNLTSQIFANFYMNGFDHYLKSQSGLRYYGRYVDDFIIVHAEKEYLKALVSKIASFLADTLQLTLHPKKIYLQHYSKGVQFLGTVIKPGRIYIAKRTKGNFYAAIQKQNKVVRNEKPNKEAEAHFLSSMNSYLGMLKHYNTYSLRKRMLFRNISAWWLNYAYLSGGIAKFILKVKPATNSHFIYR